MQLLASRMSKLPQFIQTAAMSDFERGPAPHNWAAILALASASAPVPVLQRSMQQWQALLPAAVFDITRRGGTERAFSSAMCQHFAWGRYACACCHTALFEAAKKFDSGSGWPSFTVALPSAPLAYIHDNSLGMQRIEVQCSHCAAHLGHVFADGQAPTGLRYCINALALEQGA